MQTILLVPISRGIGVTSAALGLIRAFDYNGIKAGFMKPFLQDDTLDKQLGQLKCVDHACFWPQPTSVYQPSARRTHDWG
jgi:BioD-like phosphotransacetylase family protein